MAKQVEYVRAGAIGKIRVFYFKGGRFGVDTQSVIYQDFGGSRQWVECPNDQVKAYALANELI